MKVQYLGRTLGEASGCDGDPGEDWWFYHFKPAPTINLPRCTYLQIEDSTGLFHAQDGDGNTITSYDIIETLRLVPKDET